MSASRLIDVSAWAGTTNELFFGFLGGTSTNATLTIENIRDSMVTLVVPRLRSDAAGADVEADVYAGPFVGRQYLGRLPGLRLDAYNTLYVEARDVAGEYSRPAVLPAGTDRWFVRRPRGRLLLVSDYVNSDSTFALTSYLSALQAVSGGVFSTVDILNLGRGVTLAEVGLGYLRRLGIHWPVRPGEHDVRRQYEKVWSQIGSRAIEELLPDRWQAMRLAGEAEIQRLCCSRSSDA